VHGSLATGSQEWQAQQDLASQGFRLLVPDRRGYGLSPVATGEDFLVDADDITRLMGDGAHLVGHSYGGLGAMIAAAHHPEATLSLTLLEAPASGLAQDHPVWRGFDQEIRTLWGTDLPDEEWVVQFLTTVGSDPTQFPPEMLEAAVALVPVFRHGRPYFEAELPFERLAAASFPKLVVSGGHHDGFEAMCRALAARISGSHTVIEGAGHEIQFAGQPVNDAMLTLWRTT
jgi:pimeloyl-ACP methyl ester carboxylesterase